MVSVCFMKEPGDVLRQTSPDVLSVKEYPVYIYQTWDYSCRSPQYIPANHQTTSDQLTAHGGTIAKPCNLQLYAVGFVLSIMCKLAVPHSIVTWSSLYIPQDFPLLNRYHLPHPFLNSKSGLQKHLSQVPLDPNRAKRQSRHPLRHPLSHSSNADTSWSSVILPMFRSRYGFK